MRCPLTALSGARQGTVEMHGTRLADRYELGAELGAGAMGCVYAALDTTSSEMVAVKVLHPLYARDPTAVARLQREARIVAGIDSPYVVRLLDVQQGTEPFLVMELVPGPTLGQLLSARGSVSPGEAVAVAIDVTRALVAAHAAGMVHRDLKPANIKLPGDRATVLDFGIARAADDISLTVTGMYLGTPAYSAPERGDGLGDIRSDIYSLGVLLFTMLTGAPPFDAPTPWGLIHAQRTQPLPPLPEHVPPPLREVVLRCLAKAPDDRYQLPGALLEALLAAAPAGTALPDREESPISDRTDSPTERLPLASSRPDQPTVGGWPQ